MCVGASTRLINSRGTPFYLLRRLMYDIFLRRGRTQSQALSLLGPFVSADCFCVPGDRLLCVCVCVLQGSDIPKNTRFGKTTWREEGKITCGHTRGTLSDFYLKFCVVRVSVNHFSSIYLLDVMFGFTYTPFPEKFRKCLSLRLLELFVSCVLISHEALQAEHWPQMGFSCTS